jgi:phosphotriesterase-related protein
MLNLMIKNFIFFVPFLLLLLSYGCAAPEKPQFIQDVIEVRMAEPNQIWLSHEHILVDFIGADSIQPITWNHDEVIKEIIPYLEELKEFKVDYFVDATPNFLGRDVLLLEKLAKKTGLRIVTNTGLYGARNNKFIPKYALEISAEKLSEIWIDEFANGIGGTTIKPGFIKIGIDAKEDLSEMHQKLVTAAALTHLKTGLTIASHTGKAKGLWPQLEILKSTGVSPKAFIWIHAQNEENFESFLKAAETGCWISLDAVGKKIEKHIEVILYAKKYGFLDQILLSHDAGWYDPQKQEQGIKPYTPIFELLYPKLKSQGFTDEEFNLLVSVNPSKAFSIEIKKYSNKKIK